MKHDIKELRQQLADAIAQIKPGATVEIEINGEIYTRTVTGNDYFTFDISEPIDFDHKKYCFINKTRVTAVITE